MPETRNRPRYKISFEVVYDDGQGFMTARVLDISETGVFLETTMPLVAGKRVRLTPLLPETAGIFELQGEVVRALEHDPDLDWKRSPGMGIRFVDVPQDEIDHLRRLLAEHVET